MEGQARLYIGEVAHHWMGPAGKRFRFPAPGFLLPLASLEKSVSKLSLFSIDSKTPLSLKRQDLSPFEGQKDGYLLTSPRYFGVSHFPFHCSFGAAMRTVFRRPGGSQSVRDWDALAGPEAGSGGSYQQPDLGATCRVGAFSDQLDLSLEIPGRFRAWWRGYGVPLSDTQLAAMMVRFPLNLWLNGVRRRLNLH